METVFLSFSFRDEDRELVKYVEGIIESHGLKPVTGDALGGGVLTQAIQDMITEADALVAVATPRDPIAGTNRYRTHPWVLDEMKYALARKKPAIAFRHHDVDFQGMFAENEYVDYDPTKSAPAFVKLSKIVGKWVRDDGRLLRVLLDPAEDLGRLAAKESVKCQYRLVKNGKREQFRDGHLTNEPGAPIAYINSQTGKQFEIRISSDDEEWISATESEWLRVQLKKRGN
jgi:hypothetical protein